MAVGFMLVGPISPFKADEPPPDLVAQVRLARALETRAYTERQLQRCGGGTDCLSAVFVGYANSEDHEDQADHWYNLSQVRADHALEPSRESEVGCFVSPGIAFLDRLWDVTAP